MGKTNFAKSTIKERVEKRINVFARNVIEIIKECNEYFVIVSQNFCQKIYCPTKSVHKIKIVFCIFKSLLQKFVYDCFY